MENLKEYLIYINTILSIGVIGFIIRFSLMMKTAFKEKEDVLQKRLDAFQDDLNRTEKWAERDKNALKNERDELKNKLENTLMNANVDPESLDLIGAVKEINSEFKLELKEISEKIENLKTVPVENNYDLNISMAKAFASNNEWLKAAKEYDQATSEVSDTWELYFYKGVAYANARNGKSTDLKALQAYSDAIVYANDETDSDFRSRLFIYKGAMLKRLNRLTESEKDLNLGIKFAKNEYELSDGLYNLACVNAMNEDYENFKINSSKLESRNKEKFNYLIQRLKFYAPDFDYEKNSA